MPRDIIRLNYVDFQWALDRFQEQFNEKVFTDKVPYDVWRQLRKGKQDVQIYKDGNFITIEKIVETPFGDEELVRVYTDKIYDNGFGRFLWSHYFNEKASDKMTFDSFAKASSAAASAVADCADAVKAAAPLTAKVSTSWNEIDWDKITKIDDSVAVNSATGEMYLNINGDSLSSTSATVTNGGTYSDTVTIGDPYLYDGYGNTAGTVYGYGVADYISEKADKCQVDQFEKELKDVIKKIDENKVIKENGKMTGFNFDFGPCTKDDVRLSMYGLAVKNNSGTWVSFNPETSQVVDVDILNFDGRKYMFKMPVAIKDIAVGDIIVHNRVPMFVVGTEGGIYAVDVRAGEEKKIIPTVNMFGFNFVTKIVSLFDAVGSAPTADQPFGNFLPFLMMNEDNKDFDPMMMMLMMNGSFDMSNPMMLYFMLGDKGDKSMLPMMFMMGQTNHKCDCKNS